MKRYAPLLCAAMVWVSPLAAVAQDAGDAPDTVQGVQDTAYETPAHVSLVEGSASLERDGRTDPAPSSMPLLAGDRLRTQVGRVEVLFADGSTLYLDHHTTVDFQSDEVVRLLSGRVRLNIPSALREVTYRVDAPSAWVEISYPGEYRIALVRDDEIELAVLRGSADLVNEDGRTRLSAGERAFARAGAAPSLAYVFNSAAWDAFDRWAEGRRDERLGLSTQYLPNEVRPYASTFDRYGSWRHEPTYGYVWYPTVYDNWRPYYHGRWVSLRPYGWTWIGADPWAWPTHHYGRWGFSAGVWFWIPGRHWGPAWVSWAYAPGYVSWCPLGWNNRPVFSFININIFRGRRHHFDHWRAWTVVPRRHFGRSFVNVNVVNASTLDSRVRSAFVVRNRAPEITGYAVPRSAAPIRTAGTRVRTAVPRGTAPGSSGIAAGTDAGAMREDRSAVPFRSQRPGVSTTGPGFPAAARTPRAESAGTTPRSDAPRRTAPLDSAQGRPSAARERGVTRGDAVPYDPTAGRRAVPRNSGATIDRESAPQRTPGYGVPAVRPRIDPPENRDATRVRPDSSPRIPSGDFPAYQPRQRTPYQPPAGYGVPERRREMPSSSPPVPDRPRVVPRGDDAPAAYRSAPAPRAERSAPPSYAPPRNERSAPPPRVERSAPPSYAPPRVERSAPPPSPQAEPAGRSRGGEGASGRAVRRPRGN
jgi:hypothetical protein